MAAADYLKSFRDKGGPSKGEPDKKEGMDSGEENKTPRIISLTDDEKQAFAQAKPGEDLSCEVHGTLESDGHFHVMSVSPLGGGEKYGSEEGMADQVAKRLTPSMPMISPS